MDSQQIELLGRHRLVEELLRAGLEVALPLRDHGVDLIAYRDDAAAPGPFAADAYLRQTSARSVLCLPLVKQARLIGVLYLGTASRPTCSPRRGARS